MLYLKILLLSISFGGQCTNKFMDSDLYGMMQNDSRIETHVIYSEYFCGLEFRQKIGTVNHRDMYQHTKIPFFFQTLDFRPYTYYVIYPTNRFVIPNP